ncbi:MAG: hypothetical protein EHM81_02320 [Chloroflexi bacterium]|nr:MAG: hypothetical protein EHM81_02320 [Chloroflexota bacterium]
MSTLAPDEKTTLVMAYTRDALYRGEVVTKENVRVSIWLRTEAAPRYIHLLKAQVITFGGAVKTVNYSEVYIPTTTVLAFHIAPPGHEALDYDENEKNRAMEPTTVGVGTFLFKGKLRVSAQSGLGVTLELAKIPWMSLYETEITNLNLPQMPPLGVPMLLLNPAQVSFAK